MYSDVIFGWVAWLCLSIWDFFAGYLDFFSRWVVNFKNRSGVHRRALRASLRPLCPAGPAMHTRVILKFTTHREKNKDMGKTIPNIRQSHAISQKNVAIYIITFCCMISLFPKRPLLGPGFKEGPPPPMKQIIYTPTVWP